jgi:hypothetical protein
VRHDKTPAACAGTPSREHASLPPGFAADDWLDLRAA